MRLRRASMAFYEIDPELQLSPRRAISKRALFLRWLVCFQPVDAEHGFAYNLGKHQKGQGMGLISDLFTWWHGATLSTKLYTNARGQFVGEDDRGNRYYQEPASGKEQQGGRAAG